jgi:hypothetical protein
MEFKKTEIHKLIDMVEKYKLDKPEWCGAHPQRTDIEIDYSIPHIPVLTAQEAQEWIFAKFSRGFESEYSKFLKEMKGWKS